MFAALRGHKKTRAKRVGVKSWRDYDVDCESRVARYRKTARLLRSAAETMSADRHGDLLAIATELEGLADSIAGLRSAMAYTRSNTDRA